MAGYADFGYGYGYRPPPQQRFNQPGAYGYRPQIGVTDPFAGWKPSEYEFDYYNNNSNAVIGRYLGANQVMGPQGVAPTMRAFLENYLPDAYKEYTGWNADNPEQSFADYLGMQDLTGAYEMTNPGARGLRAGYRTRYLKR